MVLVGVVALALAGMLVAWDWSKYDEPTKNRQVDEEMTTSVPLAALMYLWYGFNLDTREGQGGLGSSHWNSPGVGSAHRRGVTDEPAYGFYASDDVAVISQQLADMESAGINVILISWWGWGDSNFDGIYENGESEAMVRASKVLLDYIEENSLPFRVSFLVEPFMPNLEAINLEQQQEILNELWETFYSIYPGLMFQWEGKPLVVTWNPVSLKAPQDVRFTVKTWGSYFGEGDWKDHQDWNWFPQLDQLESSISDDGVYVIFPRFDEYWLHLMGREFSYPYRRIDPTLTEGAYETTWQVAVENRDRIKLLILYTWNEHKEHAAIEPDKGVSHLSYGRSLVEKTSKYFHLYRAGQSIPTATDSWSRPNELRHFIGNLAAAELGLNGNESVDLFLDDRLRESQSLIESHIGRSYTIGELPPAIKNIQLRLASYLYNFILMNKRNPVMQVGEFNFQLNDDRVFTDSLKSDLSPFRAGRGVKVLFP